MISLELSDFAFATAADEDEKETIDEALIPDGTKQKEYPSLLVITESGYGKQTYLDGYRKTNRAASGVKTLNMTKKTGRPVLIQILKGDEESLIVTTKNGVTIRIDPADISQIGRNSQGVKIIRLDDKDIVVSGGVS